MRTSENRVSANGLVLIIAILLILLIISIILIKNNRLIIYVDTNAIKEYEQSVKNESSTLKDYENLLEQYIKK